MIKLLHLITGLGRGGAEGTLVRLVTRMDRARFTNVVVSLGDEGVFGEELRRAGVDVRALGISGPGTAFAGYSALKRILCDAAPDVVQSWLYHADLMAALAVPRAVTLAWNLRNSDLSPSGRLSWRVLAYILARLSARPNVIVTNARANIAEHIVAGYRPRQTRVIPNGVDAQAFRPGALSADEARASFGLPQKAFLIGMPARFDSFKDHATFLAAARVLKRQVPSVRFVLAGTGTTWDNAVLAKQVRDQELSDSVHLLGDVVEMPSLYSALDLVTLTSSHGEGFPNVIAEAMASAKPVVATDVGDVREMIGDPEGVVAPRSPQAVAVAWLAVYTRSSEERLVLGERLRRRAVTSFSIEAATKAYEDLYEELVATHSNPQADAT